MIKKFSNILLESKKEDNISIIELINFSISLTIGLPIYLKSFRTKAVVKNIKKDTDNIYDYYIITTDDEKYGIYKDDTINIINLPFLDYNISKKLYKLMKFITIFNIGNIDYLDFGKSNDKISFLKRNKMFLVKEKGLDPWDNNYRTEQKIGKFLSNLFGNKVSLKDIEKFVNFYKASYNIIHKRDYDLKIVDGKDILYWYLGKNYEDGKGPLNKSCMKFKKNQSQFQIYKENKDVCKMLIKVSENDKLLCRALIWVTNKGIYMDRIYFINDYDQKLFEIFAKENNWLTYNNDWYKRMKINLTNWPNEIDEKNYPYMDTFYYIDTTNGVLYNYENDKTNLFLDYN